MTDIVDSTRLWALYAPEMAVDYGCTGPVLRGSGVDHDLRRDGEDRYTEMYDGYAFEVIVERDGHYPRDHDYPAVPSSAVLGDCWHRFYVRMLEVMQSIDLVRQAMDRYSTAKDLVDELQKWLASCGNPAPLSDMDASESTRTKQLSRPLLLTVLAATALVATWALYRLVFPPTTPPV